MRTAVEQRMGPAEGLGGGQEGLHACQRGGTNQRQIRPPRPGESEATGAERSGENAVGRGGRTFGSSELGAICMFIITLTRRAALNNSGGAGLSLQSVSPGYKGRGAGGRRRPPSPGPLKGRDRWARAGHHPVTLRAVMGFQRKTGFVNGASLLPAAFPGTPPGRVAGRAPL